MATSSKKAGPARTQRQHASLKVTDLSQYIRLRTLLDSAEVGSLRYYLNALTEAERNKHFDELRSKLQVIIDFTWSLDKGDLCPPGYHDCGGCCVPYFCPE